MLAEFIHGDLVGAVFRAHGVELVYVFLEDLADLGLEDEGADSTV